MLESLLSVGNLYWSGDSFRPAVGLNRSGVADDILAALEGRFACASVRPEGGVTLARDRLGLNKLFLAIHESGKVVVANYLVDLVSYGVPFESIHSAPSGHLVELDPKHNAVMARHYANASDHTRPSHAGLDMLARNIRRQLEVWFSRFAEQFSQRKICVCLSGGPDSGLIAALAKEYFREVTAYNCAVADPRGSTRDDTTYAKRLADALHIPLRSVRASADDVIAAVPDAICYGQDWRDFNVQCAIVHEILARAIESDVKHEGSGAVALVLTGDLVNEFLADSPPVASDGLEYYRLPGIGPSDLRLALIRGLDAGDRVVGIFGHHGLEVLQPYGLVVDHYLSLPSSLIGARSKQTLTRKVAGNLLPAFVFDRANVKDQIGSSTQPAGIVHVLKHNGYDARWLRGTFCRLFRIEQEAFLDRFIRAGRYRTINQLSGRRALINGYVAA